MITRFQNPALLPITPASPLGPAFHRGQVRTRLDTIEAVTHLLGVSPRAGRSLQATAPRCYSLRLEAAMRSAVATRPSYAGLPIRLGLVLFVLALLPRGAAAGFN